MFLVIASSISEPTLQLVEIDNVVREKIIKNTDVCKILVPESSSAICCYDISVDGKIAIGFTSHKINIYDASGDYLYTFTFKYTDASKYYVEWCKNDLRIYLTRGAIALQVSSVGDYVKVNKYATNADSSRYFKMKFGSKNRSINGFQYIMENPNSLSIFPSSTYTKFTIISPDGHAIVIYDIVNEYNLERTFLFCLQMTLILSVGVWLFHIWNKSLRKPLLEWLHSRR
ncbi:hypothetical protein [Ligaoa zhengdingensis]|uniref:hypothetical protein n=1 Tax=Ligaoa zhengdingensis TaxID=2763658 RepID=UPI0031BB90F5